MNYNRRRRTITYFWLWNITITEYLWLLMSKGMIVLISYRIWSVLIYAPLCLCECSGYSVSYTHLDVYKRQVTKLVKLYAVTRPSTRSVLNVIINKCIPEYGHTKRVLTENGKQFSNKLWYDVLTQHEIQSVLTAIRRPKDNLAERANRELGRMFLVYCHERYNKMCIRDSYIGL